MRSLIPTAASHEMTACDCNDQKMLGTTNLTRFQCYGVPPKKVLQDGIVKYEVFQQEKPAKTLTAAPVVRK